MIHTPVYHSPRPLLPIIPQLPLSITQLSTNLKVPRLFSIYFFLLLFFFESEWKFDWNHSIAKSLKIIPFFYRARILNEGREGRSFHLCTFRVTLSSNIFSFLNRLKDEGRKTRTFAYFNFIAKPWFIHLPPGKGEREWKLLVRQYSGAIFHLYLSFYFIRMKWIFISYEIFPYDLTRNITNIMFV